jgi:prevent-host-death family protein
METVGLREANVHFTRYINKVRAGAEIVLTDRGTPVAIIKPITSNECPLEIRLDQLESAGMIHRAKGSLTLSQPVSCKGGLISDTVTDLRRERC